jgi:hypothetical protein
VDGGGGFAAGAHGEDHRRGAGDDIAAGEDALARCSQRLWVGLDVIPLLVFKPGVVACTSGLAR